MYVVVSDDVGAGEGTPEMSDVPLLSGLPGLLLTWFPFPLSSFIFLTGPLAFSVLAFFCY